MCPSHEINLITQQSSRSCKQCKLHKQLRAHSPLTKQHVKQLGTDYSTTLISALYNIMSQRAPSLKPTGSTLSSLFLWQLTVSVWKEVYCNCCRDWAHGEEHIYITNLWAASWATLDSTVWWHLPPHQKWNLWNREGSRSHWKERGDTYGEKNQENYQVLHKLN